MTADGNFGRDRLVAQLAIGGEVGYIIEGWLAGEFLRFTRVAGDKPPLFDSTLAVGGEPLVISLPLGDAETGSAVAALAALAERVPVIAIVDAEMVDDLAPFLDVEPAEFVAWPCGKETFMSVLQKIGTTSLRERAAAAPISPDVLRDEVERIARALSALVESGAPAPSGGHSTRKPRESALLIRGIIRRRRARAQFFPADLFADPAWDILLDLAAARLENTRVSISSLCIAAAVPTTTALRWIKGMTGAGILEREADPEDGRRSFIRLSDHAAEAMENYLTLVDEGVV